MIIKGFIKALKTRIKTSKRGVAQSAAWLNEQKKKKGREETFENSKK